MIVVPAHLAVFVTLGCLITCVLIFAIEIKDLTKEDDEDEKSNDEKLLDLLKHHDDDT